MVTKTKDTPDEANMESFLTRIVKAAAARLDFFKSCTIVQWEAFASLPPSAALNRRGAKTWAVFPPTLKVPDNAVTKPNVDVAVNHRGAYSIFISPLEYSTQADRFEGTPRGTVEMLTDALRALLLAANDLSYGSAFQSDAARAGFEPGQGKQTGVGEDGKPTFKADWRNPRPSNTLLDALAKMVTGHESPYAQEALGDPPKVINALPFITVPGFTNLAFSCPEAIKGACDSPTLYVAPKKTDKVKMVCVEHDEPYVENKDAARARKVKWIAETAPFVPGVDLSARVLTEADVEAITAAQTEKTARVARKTAARAKAS
jgi:hypothetical protein